MPTLIQTTNGTVIGLWGSALVRSADGTLRALKVGDVVHKGDVILTSQDGIVQLEGSPDLPTQAPAQPPAEPEVDRVIAELNNPDSQDAPAAGLSGGDGGGLTPGLRVGRIAEDTTPASFSQGSDNTARVFDTERAGPPEDQLPQQVATPATPVAAVVR